MVSPVTFLREVRGELKQVTWPTRKDVYRLTVVVMLVSIAVGIYIGGLDFLFTKIFEIVIK